MQNIEATYRKIGKPQTNDRTAIVLAVRKMLHAAKVKKQWNHAAYNTAAYACSQYLADGATDAEKDKWFRKLESALAEITSLQRTH